MLGNDLEQISGLFLSKRDWVLFLGKKILEPWKSQGLELGPLEPTPHFLRPTLYQQHSRSWGRGVRGGGGETGQLIAQRGEKDPGNRWECPKPRAGLGMSPGPMWGLQLTSGWRFLLWVDTESLLLQRILL